MESKDIIVCVLVMALVSVFSFWSGGKYEMYKLRKEYIELFDGVLDSFDEVLEFDWED